VGCRSRARFTLPARNTELLEVKHKHLENPQKAAGVVWEISL